MYPLAFITETFSFIVVVALCFGALTLLASFIRFHLLTHRIEKAAAEDVDPEDRFQLRLVQELGALHQTPEPFSLYLVEPVIPPEQVEKLGADVIDDWMDAFCERVQAGVRSSDFVSRYGERQVGVVARLPAKHSHMVAKRLAESVQKTAIKAGGGLSFKWPVLLGGVACPEHGDRALDLIRHLVETVDSARTEPSRIHLLPIPDQDAGDDTAKAPTASGSKGLLDDLTGVLRESRLPMALQKFVARQRKEGQGVSVVYLSIDLFNQYRSHYDQPVTDQLLKGLADLLAVRTRENDILARAGEADFVVVMGCSPAAAWVAAQRLVAEVKRVPFRFGTTQLRITVSAGVAGYPDHTGQYQDMLSYAETAMKAAREKGRNVSLLFHPTMVRPVTKTRPVDTF